MSLSLPVSFFIIFPGPGATHLPPEGFPLTPYTCFSHTSIPTPHEPVSTISYLGINYITSLAVFSHIYSAVSTRLSAPPWRAAAVLTLLRIVSVLYRSSENVCCCSFVWDPSCDLHFPSLVSSRHLTPFLQGVTGRSPKLESVTLLCLPTVNAPTDSQKERWTGHPDRRMWSIGYSSQFSSRTENYKQIGA